MEAVPVQGWFSGETCRSGSEIEQEVFNVNLTLAEMFRLSVGYRNEAVMRNVIYIVRCLIPREHFQAIRSAREGSWIARFNHCYASKEITYLRMYDPHHGLFCGIILLGSELS